MDNLRLVLLVIGAVIVVGIVGWELLKRRRSQRELQSLDAALRGGMVQDSRADVPRPLQAVRAEPEAGDLSQAAEASATVDLGDLSALSPDSPASESVPVGDVAASGEADGEVEVEVEVPASVEHQTPPAPAVTEPLSDPAPEVIDAVAAEANQVASRESSVDDQLLVVLTLMAPGQYRFSGTRVVEVLGRCGLHYGAMQLFHFSHQSLSGGEDVVFSVANVVEPGTLDPAQLAGTSTPGLSFILQLPGPLADAEALEKLLDVGKRAAYDLGGELCDETRSVLTEQGIALLRERVANASQLRGM